MHISAARVGYMIPQQYKHPARPGVCMSEKPRTLSLTVSGLFHLPATVFTFRITQYLHKFGFGENVRINSENLQLFARCENFCRNFENLQMLGDTKGEKMTVDLKENFHFSRHSFTRAVTHNVKKCHIRATQSEIEFFASKALLQVGWAR